MGKDQYSQTIGRVTVTDGAKALGRTDGLTVETERLQ